MKLKINMDKLYPEAMFYIKWANNCKNKKTRIKLAKKARKEFMDIKEFKKIDINVFKYRFLRSYR